MQLAYLVLKPSPASANSFSKTGMDDGPMPCNASISSLVNEESLFKEVMFLLSSARLAGADNKERKPEEGLRSFSHTGHVGQLLVLLNRWPFTQVLIISSLLLLSPHFRWL